MPPLDGSIDLELLTVVSQSIQVLHQGDLHAELEIEMDHGCVPPAAALGCRFTFLSILVLLGLHVLCRFPPVQLPQSISR